MLLRKFLPDGMWLAPFSKQQQQQQQLFDGYTLLCSVPMNELNETQ
jgi:hypothetical protein